MRFARDRWYSSEGQRRLQNRARSESIGTRRIISLTLLLLMILVVMQQLGDPKKYKPAFEAIGLAPRTPFNGSGAVEPRGFQSSISSDEAGDPVLIAKEAQLAITPESSDIDLFMQMWLRLFESASPEVLNELAKAELSLSSIARAKTDEQSSLPLKPPQALLEWLITSQSRVEKWQQEYRSLMERNANEVSLEHTDLKLGMTFVTQWLAWASLHRNGVSLASSALDPDLQTGLQLAIDRQLLGIVRDNSPWRPQERPVLARTLQRAAAIADAFDESEAFRRDARQASPNIEVTSLMKQTHEYRGQVLRLVGNCVTNPDPTTQNIEGWGQFQYDVVWIRPLLGSQQPVCIYALRKPTQGWPMIAASPASQSASSSLNTSVDMDADSTQLVEISGILLKRLVYPSQRGLDVAPLLVACDVQWLPDAELDPIIPSKAGRLGFRSRRWIEPGEQAANLQVLQDIFANDLELLSEPTVQSKLTETSLPMDFDRDIPQLGRVLYQMPRVSKPLAAAITTRKKIGPAQLASFRGWVHSVETIRLRDASAASGETTTIFRLQIEPHMKDESSQGDKVHVAFVNRIPALWKSRPAISQPISLAGVYLDTTSETGMKRCWIADHADWSWPWLGEPSLSSESFSPTLPDDWRQLGATGFDLSQVDMLRSLRGKSITSQESQAFYSLIDCGDRFSKTDASFADSALSAIDCLQEKDPPYLRRIRAKVNIVRATRILVTDEHDQSALDGEAYYELDGLANLGDLSIQLKSPDGKENVLFDGEYPITLISKRIPSWLATSNDESSETPATWYPRTTVEVEGIFYRLWSFSTAQTSAIDKADNKSSLEESRLKQIGPLVAVTKWEKSLEQALPAANRSIARELTTAIGLSAISIYVVYRLNQSSKRRKA